MVFSGACWLVLVTAQMSGEPLDAIKVSAISTVLGSTVFGQAWLFRALMALLLALLWLLLRAGPPRGPWTPVVSVGIASGLLAGLAWAGHANAEIGAHGLIHHTSDAAHLLAAGVWLGGLAPLAAVLGASSGSPTTREVDGIAEIATRFGNWAALSVGILVLTGILNAYYVIPATGALLATPYGSVLLVKLLLFALMLAIAAVNRTSLTTALRANRLDDRAPVEAVRQFRRNVWVEQMLGAGIVLLVAALGVTPPPMRM
jgi:putative copper resistance protein D